MGQDASKGSFEFRYVPERECFRSKLLLVQPPSAVRSDVLTQGPTRVLRSVSVQCVAWESQTILPEQWMSILGNQLYAVFFVPYRTHTMSTGDEVLVLPAADEVTERATYAFEKIKNASPDAKLAIVIWDNAEEGYDAEELPEEEEEAPEENEGEEGNKKGTDGDDADGAAADALTTRDAAADEQGAPQADDDDDDEGKRAPTEGAVLEEGNRATLAAVDRLVKAFNTQRFVITSAKERFALGCLLSACATPPDIARPLCSLLFQLRDACAASEAYLIDSLTFYPLLSTLDEDPTTLTHHLHETLWVFNTSVRSIMKACDSDLHLMSIPCGPHKKMYVAWVCRPYAYVMLLVPNPTKTGGAGAAGGGAATTQLMVEKNIEAISMHFYNVINNTSLRKTYTPIL